MKLGSKVVYAPMKLGGKVKQPSMTFGKKVANVNTSLGGSRGSYGSDNEDTSGKKKTYYSLEKHMRHGQGGTMMV
jgi:hypothetical protein